MSISSDMADLPDLLVDQEQQFNAIRRVADSITDKATLTRAKAASRLDYLQVLWDKCTTLNVQLYQVATRREDRDGPYFVEREFSTMEDIFLDTVSNLKEYLYGPPANAPASSTSTSSEPRCRPMQVPLIKLPRFSGICTDWPEFRDYFTSLFISDPSFDNLQRLHYLKACLDGEAAQLLKHMSTTADNFDIAWKTLSDRFSNKRRVINMHLVNLFSLKYVTHESSPQ